MNSLKKEEGGGRKGSAGQGKEKVRSGWEGASKQGDAEELVPVPQSDDWKRLRLL